MDSDDEIYPDEDEYKPEVGPKTTAKDEPMEDEEEGEEVESDDSDDDINFITDTKQEARPETSSQSKNRPAHVKEEEEVRKISGTPQPSIKAENTPQLSINRLATPLDDGRSGSEYPARHTSTLDPLNGNPIHPATGKPILGTDLDADFPAESSKPWRKPGADNTDYFNYGFDEFTWASYCLKKQQMPDEVSKIHKETEQMKAFVDGIGGGGMPGAVPAMGGMPPMPGMPSEQEMAVMLQQMQASGMDPSQMDGNQMMAMFGGMGQFPQGQQPPTGPSGFNNNAGGYQDNYQGGGRGRGRGGRRNW